MLFICARRAKTALMQCIDAREKYLITKVVFLRFCSRFFTTPNFRY